MIQPKLIVVIPEVLDSPEPVLLSSQGTLKELLTKSHVSAIAPGPITPTALLGFDPASYPSIPGPLVCAAFGARPGSRAVQMRLTLASMTEDERLAFRIPAPTLDEEREIVASLARLATKTLIPVEGNGLEHALVWENGSLNLSLTEPRAADGESVYPNLPAGDADRYLRMFVQDSIDLLSGLEFNRRKVGEGKPTLNVLWPWGAGLGFALPNLILRYGAPVVAHSDSLELKGAIRLGGGDFRAITREQKGVFIHAARLREVNPGPDYHVLPLLGMRDAVESQRFDEIGRTLHDLGPALLDRWTLDPNVKAKILFVLPSKLDPKFGGIAVEFNPESITKFQVPFERQHLMEERLPSEPIWARIDRFLAPVNMP